MLNIKSEVVYLVEIRKGALTADQLTELRAMFEYQQIRSILIETEDGRSVTIRLPSEAR